MPLAGGIPELAPFPRCKRRDIKARFSGGAITANGGAALPREAGRMLGLTGQASGALADPRRKASCRRMNLPMLRQRVFGLALGYEELNDHDEPRSDPAPRELSSFRATPAWGCVCLKDVKPPRSIVKHSGKCSERAENHHERPGSRLAGTVTPCQSAKTTDSLPNQRTRAISGPNDSGAIFPNTGTSV